MFTKETYVQRRAQLKKQSAPEYYCFWVTMNKG